MVDNGEFEMLCDPRVEANQTLCAHCGKHDVLSNFQWDDTGETLSDYRKRLRTLVPFLSRVAGAWWMFALWTVLAIGVGTLLSRFIADARIAFGVPAVVFFVIAMACDAIGKFSKPSIPYHHYK